MMPATRRIAVMLLPLLLFVRTARAEHPPTISDGAGLFSKHAIAKATREIEEVRKLYHRDLVVVTVDDLPDPPKVPFILVPKERRARRQQVRQRAEELGVDGVLLLISRKPDMIIAVAWPPIHERVFSDADAVAVESAVRRNLKKLAQDQALLDAVAEVRSIFAANMADQIDPHKPTDDVLMAVSLAVGALVVALVVFLRRKFALSRIPPEQVPARLACMFGSPANHWICDKLFVSPPPAAVASAPATPAAPASPAVQPAAGVTGTQGTNP